MSQNKDAVKLSESPNVEKTRKSLAVPSFLTAKVFFFPKVTCSEMENILCAPVLFLLSILWKNSELNVSINKFDTLCMFALFSCFCAVTECSFAPFRWPLQALRTGNCDELMQDWWWWDFRVLWCNFRVLWCSFRVLWCFSGCCTFFRVLWCMRV